LLEVSFGEWLKRQRSGRGLTQEQLAQQIGCATITLRKIESEERRPSAQIVERLAEALNIPSNEQTAFLQFARGDWQSAPAIKSEAMPWHASPAGSRSNLPTALTSFIGREQETASVREYLLSPNIRIVTLIGPPGIGKTRLSLAAAHKALSDIPDGAFFVALAPLEDSSLIAPTIVQTLGLAETELGSPFERLKGGIGDKHMLLVLDNVEHIIEGAAFLISDLLSACPCLKILTTSREALRVPGEWLYPVPALKMPTETQLRSMDMEGVSQYAALALFAERARAVRSDFVLNADNIQAVTAICTQLDGLPLAIELIAARIRFMSPPALLAKLNSQFILSADGMRAVPTRQKTLHNAMSWSYNLLSPEEQKLFVRLSVFADGFTPDAAETIFSRTVTNKSVSDLIDSLLDKSLLQRTLSSHGSPRFNMLVTVQQFALDGLRQMGEEAGVRNWHLDYFLDLAVQANKRIYGPDQVAWLDYLETEHNNYRAALDWCLSNQYTELALKLLGALGWALLMQHQNFETYGWFDKIRNLPNVTKYPALYARVLNQGGFLGWFLSDYRHARSILEESQAVWLKLGVEGEQGLAEALNFVGMIVRWGDGDNDKAGSLFEKSLELYQKHEDEWGIAMVLLNLGKVADHRNNDASALSLLEQSLGLFRQLGDMWGIGRSCFFLGQLFLKQGNHEKARFFFNQYLMICKALRFRLGTVLALNGLGDSYRHQGNYAQAEQFYEKVLIFSREYSVKEGYSGAFFSLGLVALHRSDYMLAARYFKDAYNIGRTLHVTWSAVDFLGGLAAIAAGMNQFERAAKLHGAAKALFNRFDLPDMSYDRVESDSLLQIARNQLGDEKFEALSAEGRAMTVEQAIAYAFEKSDG